MGTHVNNAGKGDIAKSILLPGDPLRAKYIAETYLEDAVLFNDVRNMLGYTGNYKGKRVSVMGTGMGIPSITMYAHELITEYDVKNLIRIGTGGAFQPELNLGDIVLGIACSTDSNLQHTYRLNGQFAANASWPLLTKAYELAKDLDIPLHAGNILSSDVFYEEDVDWWKYWAKMGVLAVEMEAAGLYTVASYFNVNALAMVTITDSFVKDEKASIEERKTANEKMLELALEIATSDD